MEELNTSRTKNKALKEQLINIEELNNEEKVLQETLAKYMNQKKEKIEKHLKCATNEVTGLEENKSVLEQLLEETQRKNELLIEILAQKDMEISHLKGKVDEMRCEN